MSVRQTVCHHKHVVKSTGERETRWFFRRLARYNFEVDSAIFTPGVNFDNKAGTINSAPVPHPPAISSHTALTHNDILRRYRLTDCMSDMDSYRPATHADNRKELCICDAREFRLS